MSGSDVDNWSEDQLIQWIERHNINADNVNDVSELRMLVKNNMERGSDDAADEEEENSSNQRMIAEILKKDKAKRRDLSELYADIRLFNILFGRDTCLTDVYPKLYEEIKTHVNDLDDKECAIVVAGELSSGKSSLFNLLIGEDIFPTSHLACTSTIARLHNSARMALEVTIDEHDDPITFENIRDVPELKEYMDIYARHNREGDESPCKQIDIFWPVPILPKNILLVDVPGVGESEEMDKMVIDYLNKALACIYVLFSPNDGGVQRDKLQKIIRERFRATNECMSQYAFNSTLFVCNYWDVVVDSEQEVEVWNDIIAKLENLIPNLNRDNVVKMSIKETRHWDTFSSFFDQDVLSEARIQQYMLRGIEGHLAKRRHLAKLTREEKQRKMEETRVELDSIIKESDKVTQIVTDMAKRRLSEISKQLHSHIHEKDTKERFLNCKNESDPGASLKKDSRVLKYCIEQRVQCKLQTLISDWERKHQQFASLQKDVNVQVEKFLSDIAKKVRRIDFDLTHRSHENISDLATQSFKRRPELQLGEDPAEYSQVWVEPQTHRRALKHGNIVGYVGVYLYKPERSEKPTSRDVPSAWISIYGSRIAFVLQLCDESLESKVFRRYKLQERLKSGRRRDEALTFFKRTIEGICAALVYMHERDYMHRDLKVSNVLLKNGVPKLADFGLTRMLAFSHGTMAGTPTHMSPEMLSNEDYLNSTDIYSLGILMWEMWYGRHAYTEEAYQNMALLSFVQTVVAGQRPPLEVGVQMPTRLKRLVAKCWNGDPFERPTANALSGAIRDVFRV